MKEIWKHIKEYEKKYQVSNKGNIKSLKRNKLLSLNWLDDDGYRRVNFFQNKKRKHFSIHQLVAIHFIPNPDNKPVVNHLDGNKLNNKSSNLEWATRSENDLHAYKIGLRKPPKTAFKPGHIPWHKKKTNV